MKVLVQIAMSSLMVLTTANATPMPDLSRSAMIAREKYYTLMVQKTENLESQNLPERRKELEANGMTVKRLIDIINFPGVEGAPPNVIENAWNDLNTLLSINDQMHDEASLVLSEIEDYAIRNQTEAVVVAYLNFTADVGRLVPISWRSRYLEAGRRILNKKFAESSAKKEADAQKAWLRLLNELYQIHKSCEELLTKG